MTNETLSTSKARTQLYSLVEKAHKFGQSFTFTKGGEPKAVLVSSEEFESWQETLDILQDKELTQQIRQGREDVAKGRIVSIDEL